jgi:hypothetical protein
MKLVAQIHPRMPVILPEQHHAAWLGETERGNLKALLVPYPADQMRMSEISPRINIPKNDDSLLWKPVYAEPTQRTTNALELARGGASSVSALTNLHGWSPRRIRCPLSFVGRRDLNLVNALSLQ